MLIYQVAKNAGYELDMANVDREKLMARAILGAVDSRFMEGLMRETIKEMPKEKYPKRKVLVKGRMDEDKSKGRE
jgi:toxin-antitoxin system, toxin component, fic family